MIPAGEQSSHCSSHSTNRKLTICPPSAPPIPSATATMAWETLPEAKHLRLVKIRIGKTLPE